MKLYRHAVGLTIVALVATGCGARLSDEDLEFGRKAALGGDPVIVDAGGGGIVSDGGTGATGGTGGTGGTGTTDGTGGTGGTGGATGGSTGGSTGGTTGGTTGGGTGGTTGGTADTGTRAAPPNGNGGDTETGVTETTIKVVNVADVGGALPGLFADARLATVAFFTYFASTEGTIYGRSFDLQVKDSRIDDSANRSAYLDACENFFGAVGSMSANDGGAASAIEGCSLPDVRTAAVNEAIQNVATVYGMDAMKPGLLPTSEYNYWGEQHPEAIKKAAYLYIDNATTEYQGIQNRAGTEKVGYVWEHVAAIGLAETNYSSHVIAMKDKEIEFVTIQGSITNATRLAAAMAQQNFVPKVYALQTNLYTPDLIKEGGANIQGAQIAVTGSLLEEISTNPEMQLYAEWLARVDPNARPTGLGMYAWSSARMFTDMVKAVGPNLTRAALVQELAKVRGYDNHGLIPPQDVGTKTPTDCIIIVEVSGEVFKRVEPATGTGFRCDNKVVTTS